MDLFFNDEKEVAKDKASKTYHKTVEEESMSSSSSVSTYSSSEEEEEDTIIILKEPAKKKEEDTLTQLITEKLSQIESVCDTILKHISIQSEKPAFNSVYIPHIGTKWNIDPKNKTWIYPPHLYSVVSIPNINQKAITLFESNTEYKTNTIESGVFETADGVLGTVLGDFLGTKEGVYMFYIKEWIKGGLAYTLQKENFPICIHIQIILKNRKTDTEKKKVLFELN